MEWRFLILSIYFFGKRINPETFATVKIIIKDTGMKKCIRQSLWILLNVIIVGFIACERLDNTDKHIADKSFEYVELHEVAEIMSLLPINSEQLNEVHAAVSSSSGNGYDEEYTMTNLFSVPGSGVGDKAVRSSGIYAVPLRTLISELVMDMVEDDSRAKSDYSGLNVARTLDRIGADAFLNALAQSDMQIYWPFSESWDGAQMPIITYDPEDGSSCNIGYRLFVDDDGFRQVEEVVVDEEMAKTRPVWVINRNDDAQFTTLEMLRREDPNWGEGGGNIIVRPATSAAQTKAAKGKSRSLLLKDFTMKRNYDTWFAGGSEFFVLTITGGCSFA